jgi:hypothetical protein
MKSCPTNEFGRFQAPLVVFGQHQHRGQGNNLLETKWLVNGGQIAYQGEEWDWV